MAALSEWLQLMLAEIVRKREESDRAMEEAERRRTEEREPKGEKRRPRVANE
jgi:hypothetical protein